MAETFADIVFPFSKADRLTGSVNSIRLRRWEYQHEVLIVDVWSGVGNDLRLRSGAPVAARVKGKAARPLNFVGYVERVVEDLQANMPGKHLNRIISVGPTYRMKDAKQRTWTDVTISDIARSICAEYRLTADVEDHSTRYESIHQSGETDWQFLCRIARQHGYVIYPTGTTIHFHSRSMQESLKHQQALQFVYSDAREGRTNIWKYKAKLGDSVAGSEGPQVRRIVSNVDLRTGEIFSTTSDNFVAPTTRDQSAAPQFVGFDPTITATSPLDAQVRTAGAKERARWAYLMDAEVDGDPTVEPTSVLHLDRLSNGYDGYWSTIGVEHFFDSMYTYHMNVEVGTNSLGRSFVPASTSANRPATINRRLSQPQLLVPGSGASVPAFGGPITDYVWVGDVASTEIQTATLLPYRRS